MADGEKLAPESSLFVEPGLHGQRQVKWEVYQALALVVGILILLLYASKSPHSLTTFSISVLVAAASMAVGLFVGFLFGIPRPNDQSDSTIKPLVPGTSKITYKRNSNLVEISDWLTKMIVGVGLFELSKIPGKLRSLGEYMAYAFGADAVPSALVIAIICYFTIFGFLLGYLWATIYLLKEFTEPS